MKLKDGFVVQKVGNAYLAVAVGARADDFNAMVRMNGTGAFLWNLLSAGEKTHEELVLAVMSEYQGVSREVAEADIIKFENQLKDGGLLDE